MIGGYDNTEAQLAVFAAAQLNIILWVNNKNGDCQSSGKSLDVLLVTRYDFLSLSASFL